MPELASPPSAEPARLKEAVRPEGPRYRYTIEEYLSFERRADSKHEYYAGNIYAMVGATEPHVLIVNNVGGELRTRLKGRPCKVYSNDLRLKVDPTGLYTYPDVMVVCGQVRFAGDRRDMIENPQVIFEVLSPSTADYDRGDKFEHYRTIASLTDYLLISQDARRVEHHACQSDGSWKRSEILGAGVVPLPSIGCELPLDEIYDKTELSA